MYVPPTGREFDCIVAGSCVADVLCKPVDLSEPLGRGTLHATDPIVMTPGGITSNTGICLATLGCKTAVLSRVGNDAWGDALRQLLEQGGVDASLVETHESRPSSVSVVAIAPDGERTFLHYGGAPRTLNADALADYEHLWPKTRALLWGYYGMREENDRGMPAVFDAARRAGALTAMDAAGTGGAMSPLDQILPHLDVYLPSRAEAEHQTGESDPQTMLRRYREAGAKGILGIKLGGAEGAIISPATESFFHVPSCSPPAAVVDTTGAGDSFYAGFLAGLLKGLEVRPAARLACATAAYTVTSLGGSAAAPTYEQAAAL